MLQASMSVWNNSRDQKFEFDWQHVSTSTEAFFLQPDVYVRKLVCVLKKSQSQIPMLRLGKN